MKNIFKNKNILVTGGVGSIGSEIVKQLLSYLPGSVRVFDNNEHLLFKLQRLVARNNVVRPLLGDIRDIDRLKKALDGIDTVFHAAALKHVEISEYNPFEAIQTNVIGTQNVIDASLTEEVDRVIVISTDKAVNPISTMGATKLVAEKLTIAAYYHKGTKKTRFGVVRFGNVMESNGSVIPTWIEQIKSGEPLTITDRRMTRFMMSITDAVRLVFEAAHEVKAGEIFILKMPALKVSDLAVVLIKALSSKYCYNPKSIKIVETGIRPGEKLHEELITKEESEVLYENNHVFIVIPKQEIVGLKIRPVSYPYRRVTSKQLRSYSSDSQQLLNHSQIFNMLKKANII